MLIAALQSAMHLVLRVSLCIYVAHLCCSSYPRGQGSPPAYHNLVVGNLALQSALCCKPDQLSMYGVKGKCSGYALGYP